MVIVCTWAYISIVDGDPFIDTENTISIIISAKPVESTGFDISIGSKSKAATDYAMPCYSAVFCRLCHCLALTHHGAVTSAVGPWRVPLQSFVIVTGAWRTGYVGGILFLMNSNALRTTCKVAAAQHNFDISRR